MKKLLVLLTLMSCVVLVFAYSTAQAGPPEKVTVCHVDPDPCDGLEPCLIEPDPHVIEISERALTAHLAHGDHLTTQLPGESCVPLY